MSRVMQRLGLAVDAAAAAVLRGADSGEVGFRWSVVDSWLGWDGEPTGSRGLAAVGDTDGTSCIWDWSTGAPSGGEEWAGREEEEEEKEEGAAAGTAAGNGAGES